MGDYGDHPQHHHLAHEAEESSEDDEERRGRCDADDLFLAFALSGDADDQRDLFLVLVVHDERRNDRADQQHYEEEAPRSQGLVEREEREDRGVVVAKVAAGWCEGVDETGARGVRIGAMMLRRNS